MADATSARRPRRLPGTVWVPGLKPAVAAWLLVQAVSISVVAQLAVGHDTDPVHWVFGGVYVATAAAAGPVLYRMTRRPTFDEAFASIWRADRLADVVTIRPAETCPCCPDPNDDGPEGDPEDDRYDDRGY